MINDSCLIQDIGGIPPMSSRGARGKTVKDYRRAHSAHPGNERFWERQYESTRVPDLAGGLRCGRHLPTVACSFGFRHCWCRIHYPHLRQERHVKKGMLGGPAVRDKMRQRTTATSRCCANTSAKALSQRRGRAFLNGPSAIGAKRCVYRRQLCEWSFDRVHLRAAVPVNTSSSARSAGAGSVTA